MNRTRGILALLAVLGIGAATAVGGPFMSSYWNKTAGDGVHWGPTYAPENPTLQGAWGEPVPIAAPYNAKPPNGADAARAMLAQSMPLDMLQQSGYFQDQSVPIQLAGGQCPGGVCPIGPPGMGGIAPPGMGGMVGAPLPPALRPPGAVAAVGALTGPTGSPFPISRTEVRFVGPAGMRISWYGPTAEGKGGFSATYLDAPASYNFLQASIYRLKLSHIPNRPGLSLYPTLEVVPAKAKTCTFLAHSAVPVVFTEEDFEQVAAGNFVVKVIYLPDPQFQDLAALGPDEVVSSRLEPGVDPIVEAKRRGNILLVVRLGNINLEAENTPPMDAPNPFQPAMPHGAMASGMAPPGQMAPGMPPAPPMVPYGTANGQPMPGGMNGMQPPPGMVPPGMAAPGRMLPSMPGAPNTYPAGTQFPNQPGLPVSQNAQPSMVEQTRYLQTTTAAAQQVDQPPARKPTVAELAPQNTSWKPSGSR